MCDANWWRFRRDDSGNSDATVDGRRKGRGGEAAIARRCFWARFRIIRLTTELLAENAVFFLQLGDHVLLLTVDESGEGDEQELLGLLEHTCVTTFVGTEAELSRRLVIRERK